MKPFVNWNKKKEKRSDTSSNHQKTTETDDLMFRLAHQQDLIFDILQRQSKIKKLKRPLKWIKEKKNYSIKKRLNNYEPKDTKTFEWQTITDNIHTECWQHPKRNTSSIGINTKLNNFIKTLCYLICFLILIFVVLLLGITFK